MKISKISIIYFLLISLLCRCQSNDKKNITKTSDLSHLKGGKKKKKKTAEIDTSKIGILVMKENKTKKDQLLMLKNAAFCSCVGHEEYKIQKENNNKFIPIPDNSFTGYMNYSDLGVEAFLKNPELDRLIEKWSQKQYNSKPPEGENEKTYLVYMKCLDFYNSEELKKYIDSL